MGPFVAEIFSSDRWIRTGSPGLFCFPVTEKTGCLLMVLSSRCLFPQSLQVCTSDRAILHNGCIESQAGGRGKQK